MESTQVVVTRSLHGRLEREAAVALYRETFGLADTDPAMTPKLLAALQHNGGSAVGAFDSAGQLVGFAYGFLGADTTTGTAVPYHYSQAAVVAHSQQGRGIGRRLKVAQADIARATGARTMRWAYDPVLARNAHFNLDVLGARGRWFHRDYYDQYDAAGRTDRVVVEWELPGGPSRPAPPAPAAGELGDLGFGAVLDVAAGSRALLIPTDWSTSADPDAGRRIRDRIADRLEELLPAGWVLTSCQRVDDARAVYLLANSPVTP